MIKLSNNQYSIGIKRSYKLTMSQVERVHVNFTSHGKLEIQISNRDKTLNTHRERKTGEGRENVWQ